MGSFKNIFAMPKYLKLLFQWKCLSKHLINSLWFIFNEIRIEERKNILIISGSYKIIILIEFSVTLYENENINNEWATYEN